MIQKWDLSPSPFEKDPLRHKVRLHAAQEDLSELMSNIPHSCSEPFVTLAREYNWFFYIPSLPPESQARVIEVLRKFCDGHTIHGENIAPVPATPQVAQPVEPKNSSAPEALAPETVQFSNIEPAKEESSSKVQNISVVATQEEKLGTGVMAEADDPALIARAQRQAGEVDVLDEAAIPKTVSNAGAPTEEVRRALSMVMQAPPVSGELDSGLAEITLVEYVGFYPDTCKPFFEKIMPLLNDQIRKFKLKIRLSEAAQISYAYGKEMDYAFLKDGCVANRCYRALILGPLSKEGVNEAKFFTDLHTVSLNAHITLHCISWSGLSRDVDLMSCALEMSIPTARLSASQAPHRRF